MLRNVRALHGCRVRAVDGDAGRVDHLLFDDRAFAIRHLVVRRGGRVLGQRVLVAPETIRMRSDTTPFLQVGLTCCQIATCPDFMTDPPMSLQYTVADLVEDATSLLGTLIPRAWLAVVPPALRSFVPPVESASEHDHNHRNTRLHSTREVIGYRLDTFTGRAGRVIDLLVDDESWTIAHAVARPHLAWAARRIVIPCHCIDGISWEQSSVSVDMDALFRYDTSARTGEMRHVRPNHHRDRECDPRESVS